MPQTGPRGSSSSPPPSQRSDDKTVNLSRPTVPWSLRSRAHYVLVNFGAVALTMFLLLFVIGDASLSWTPLLILLAAFIVQGWFWYPLAKKRHEKRLSSAN